MIQCHTFNSFTRLDVRDGGPYILSQFVGGMAAPLFLFMAGMTMAFLMDSLERRELDPGRRWLQALRRAGYVFAMALAFRLTNWILSMPHPEFEELSKVDILNCMGVAMAAFSVAALFDGKGRVRFALAVGLAIAVASPVMANLPWDGAPRMLREYLVPGTGRGRFAFFPCASYVGFGLAAGAIVKRTAPDRMDRIMQWSVLIGVTLAFSAQYFSIIPFSIYAKSSFWTDSPALIFIRFGVALLMLAGSYLWTEFGAGAGWSWMQCLGKNSLMVYWVHVTLVYGIVSKPVKRVLTIPQTVVATAAVIASMVALSAWWVSWKARRAERWKAATTVAGGAVARLTPIPLPDR